MLEKVSQSAAPAGYIPLSAMAPRRQERLWSLDVLVVDDDEADASLVAEALRRNQRVRSAQTISSSILALKQLTSGQVRPHLILLDLQMPRLNGFEFLEALRDPPHRMQTPVAILTTSGAERDVSHALRTDVLTYVVKPDSFPELCRRIDAMIDKINTGK